MNALQIYHDAEWALEHNKITLGEFDERIKSLADVEAVVRCKDCEWHEMRGEMLLCKAQDKPHTYDWFCADAKRKDGDGE